MTLTVLQTEGSITQRKRYKEKATHQVDGVAIPDRQNTMILNQKRQIRYRRSKLGYVYVRRASMNTGYSLSSVPARARQEYRRKL